MTLVGGNPGRQLRPNTRDAAMRDLATKGAIDLNSFALSSDFMWLLLTPALFWLAGSVF